MFKNKPAPRLVIHKNIIEMIKAKSKEREQEMRSKGLGNQADQLRPTSAFICEICKKLKLPKPPHVILEQSSQFCACNSSLRMVYSPFHSNIAKKKLSLTSSFNPSILRSRSKPINLKNHSEKNLVATGVRITTEQRKRSISVPDSNRFEFTTPIPDLTYYETIEREYKYLIFKGNNSSLIQSILKLRPNWSEAENGRQSLQFIWHPTSVKARFDRLMPYLPIQVINHFEFHAQLSNKLLLYNNMVNYCRLKSIDITKLMPITFPLNVGSKDFTAQMSKFIGFFKTCSSSDSKNFWLLKPSGFNRGRGIHIFNEISTLRSLLADTQFSSQNPSKTTGLIKKSPFSTKFVLQKYIENPLLIDGRKFDIRVWVLITHEYDCFFFSQGYLRTSSESFTLDEDKLTSEYIHLTNNAIQKDGSGYGKFEAGNQLPFSFLQKYLNKQFPSITSPLERLVTSMKELVAHSLKSVKGKLNPNNRQFCFEIFGYDFIIDSTMKPWLIECNTNPCLELSSPLLQQLIPRMVNDAFKLTLDVIFPIKSSYSLNIPTIVHLQEHNQWEFLVSLKKSSCND
ncbi:unnamed protein product [Blepharisma stoltei]|uniref:Tubulin-tyrosine ligase n=1 Tax=Blepharisma stoltei TaxID=1481888 RepID=A0AAU9JV22_9CILI|nr:unnamed protein product [Blepharisma stoltei]